MFKKALIFISVMTIAAVAWAQDITVSASVTANKISLKDAGQLTLTVSGVKDNIDAPTLPKVDGLDIQYLGPSTQITIVNGQYSSQRSFIYNLFPSKTGQVQIPSIKITVNGQDFNTEPINLEVVDGPAAQNTSSDQAPAENLSDKIFLVLASTKSQVYMGEKIPIIMKLFVSGVQVRNIEFPQMDKTGFQMEDVGQPQQYAQTVNGVQYNVVDFRTFIYPTRTGELEIGPAQMQVNLLYKTKERGNPFGNNVFNDDFFGGMFDSYQVRPVMVKSQPLKLTVQDLPSESKPADFSGAVGQLDFTASISPTDVKVGDPVTLKMKVSGSANFKSIQMPTFNDSRFKTYEPQIKDEGNAKTLEQVIIPTTEQIVEIPALTFSYFDALDGQYKTLSQGPFSLKVSPPAQGEEFKAVGFSDLPQTQSVQVGQIDYVEKYIKTPAVQLLELVKTLRFWLVVIGIALLLGGWFAWRRFQDRLNKDTAYARRLNAGRNAKQGLAQAEKILKTGNAPDFYAALNKTLHTYIKDKSLNENDVSGLKTIFERGDMVRFAGGQVDPTQMRQDLDAARTIIK
jgi:hypothetical protein